MSEHLESSSQALVSEASRRIALVTGVGRSVGIGAGIARELARQGWDLVLNHWQPYDSRMPWGEQPDDVTDLVNELGKLGASVTALPVDLSRTEAVSELFARIDEQVGRISAMVLSHAESVDSAILDTTLESFERHFAVNARASWQLIAQFAQQAGESGGAIVALTSDHTAYNLPYGASKGALDRIVIAAARELGAANISANVLNPGPVDTGWMDAKTRTELTALQPTGRLGTPGDVAPTVAFLVSDAGRWISGQLIKVDGGFSA